MRRKILIELISFLLILLFFYAALNKLTDYQKFVIQIGQSPLLIGLGSYLAWPVIALELILPILLMMPRTRLAGLYASFTLMVMFTAYIAAILTVSSYVPCSCGGILETLGWKEHLLFNCCYVLLALTGVILQVKETRSLQPPTYA